MQSMQKMNYKMAIWDVKDYSITDTYREYLDNEHNIQPLFQRVMRRAWAIRHVRNVIKIIFINKIH